MEQLCRLCGQPSEEIRCKITDKALQIEQKLNDCCRWKSYKDDENLPEIICISCFECLERSWRFCEMVAATQTHLKEIFSDWKPDSQQPMNPGLPSATIEPHFKDEFTDDDHSFEELPLNNWSEDEMDVGTLPQIKVEPLILLGTEINGSQMPSGHPERLYKAEPFDEEAIEDNEKLKIDTIKFPQCLEPHERNADGTANPKAMARLNLCDWSIYQHQCHECWMIFTDNAEMKRHYAQEHLLVKIRHKCWLCAENRSYSKRNTLIRHIRRHHIHHLASCCRYCNTHFWDSKLFKKHEKLRGCRPQLKKAVESVVCEHCGLICSNLASYRYHQYNKHLSNDLKPVFECFLCHMDVFDSRLKLKRHIALNHIGKKLVQCSVCNCVLNKQSLARHEKIHSDETPFICSFAKPCGTPCGKAFKFSRGLEVHERIHRGYRPYKCRAEGCDYATSDGGNIYKHMRQKHKMVFPKKGIMNEHREMEQRTKNAPHSK